LAGSDPVPGDPDEVERAAKSLADMAEEITRQTANLTRLATVEGWDAEAGRTFADSAGELSGQLGKAHGRYATTAGALRGYAPELRHAQSVADAALAEAKQAQVSVNANRPPDYPPAGSPTAAQVSAERQRQYAYDDGVDALNAAQRKLTDATDHRDEHAGRAARTIRDNIDQDGVKDSWWDEFTNWVSEHADLLRAIAQIAELVADVLSTIALAISFIPFLNFLTPVLLGLAALASVVALVCHVVLALAGEGSWLDVGLALLAVATAGKVKAGMPRGIGKEGADAAQTATRSVPSPSEGQRVWRIYGQQMDATGHPLPAGARPFGQSWTPVDPALSPNYRSEAGLPNENPGRFFIEGTLRRPENVTEVRPALPLDGNPGGWPEYVIENSKEAVDVTRIGGVNEPWTHQPGEWGP